MRPLISVIIPVYNTGAYLRRCVQSVIAQTLTDWELTLIDDGSEADTARLCDELAQSDTRINVVHKKNEGVSIARNLGLSLAKGDFISFIDSDDWVKPTFLEEMSKAMTDEVDIVIIDSTTIYSNGRTEPDEIAALKSGISSKEELTPNVLIDTAGGPCRCMYRKIVIIENEITFPVGLKFSEDRIFNLKAMGCSRAIFYLKRPLYCRYMRNGSAVSSFYSDMPDIIERARTLTREALQEHWQPFEEYASVYERQTVGLFYTSINNLWSSKTGMSLSERITETRKIVNNDVLRNAIATVGDESARARLVNGKRTYLLSLLSLIINVKHKLWR